MVHYIANGLPFYCHGIQELDAFRHVVCLLVDQGLCRRVDIVKSFCVTDDFVGKALRIYREKGHSGLTKGRKEGEPIRLLAKCWRTFSESWTKARVSTALPKKWGLVKGLSVIRSTKTI
jgi:hypothetical protein